MKKIHTISSNYFVQAQNAHMLVMEKEMMLRMLAGDDNEKLNSLMDEVALMSVKTQHNLQACLDIVIGREREKKIEEYLRFARWRDPFSINEEHTVRIDQMDRPPDTMANNMILDAMEIDAGE